jgi:hypothetical protein
MKKTFLTLFIMISAFLSVAQETNLKELGVMFANLSGFGLTYRTGSNSSVWRFSGLGIAAGNNNDDSNPDSDYKLTGYSFSVRVGREIRNQITPKLEFRHGVDVSYAYQQSKLKYESGFTHYETRSQVSVPGINAVLGFNFLINENFIVGAELLPGVNYKFGETSRQNFQDDTNAKKDISGFSFSLTNSANLTFIYRFTNPE